MTRELSSEALRMMRHCIGADVSLPPRLARNRHVHQQRGVRNFYIAGVSQTVVWDELENRGLAVCVERIDGGLSRFALTDEGIALVRAAR